MSQPEAHSQRSQHVVQDTKESNTAEQVPDEPGRICRKTGTTNTAEQVPYATRSSVPAQSDVGSIETEDSAESNENAIGEQSAEEMQGGVKNGCISTQSTSITSSSVAHAESVRCHVVVLACRIVVTDHLDEVKLLQVTNAIYSLVNGLLPQSNGKIGNTLDPRVEAKLSILGGVVTEFLNRAWAEPLTYC